MIDEKRINQRASDLAALLHERLGVKGPGLSNALKRARRVLPRRLLGAGQVIENALEHAGHPKLSKILNPVEIDAAFAELNDYLMQVDVAERWRARLISTLARLAFIFIVIAATLIWWLNWRGFV